MIENKEFFEAVQSIIPRLRHYAWLLTGSRDVADDYTQAWLERLIQEKHLITTANYDVAFFRVFHRVVSDAEIRLDTGRPNGSIKLEHQLLALPVDQRTAILLVHVEGFTRAQAAFITGITVDALSHKLTVGCATLKSRISAPVFIIEDEIVASLDMSRLIEGFGHSVCGTASGISEAKAAIETTRPQLILADVQLGSSTHGGIDICEEMRRLYNLPVIYVTGHPDRVRASVKREGVFIVAKPVEPETLRTAMGLALSVMAPSGERA